MDSVAGEYRYKIAYQGIPVADAKLTVRSGAPFFPGALSISAEAKSNEAIDIFYRLRHRSESLISLSNYRPLRYVMRQKENKRESSSEIAFGEDGQIDAISIKDLKKNNIESFSFAPGNPVFDPISAAFLAKSIPIKVGEDVVFDVFNGKHRYLITFHIYGKEKIKIGETEREAFSITPTVKKLTESKGEEKLKSARIWISADARRDILKLESKVWIGSVSATMTGFTPSTPSLRQANLPDSPESISSGGVTRARMR